MGAGFEGWVHDFLDSMKPEAKARVLEASQGIPLLKASDSGNAKKDEKGHSHDEHESEWDPHVWVSPVNAKLMALNIKNSLVALDSSHKADYEANYKLFADRLDQLDSSFKQSLGPLPNKKIVVAHDSFGYLSKEYGLTQLPIMGLSPDAEPTAQTMKDINAFIKTNKLKYIFFEELVSDKVAKTLAGDAGIETLVLNPVEGLTEAQMKAGLDYVTIMETNLKNLLKALQ
jgi:zinc transport system substrate-binding protein